MKIVLEVVVVFALPLAHILQGINRSNQNGLNAVDIFSAGGLASQIRRGAKKKVLDSFRGI